MKGAALLGAAGVGLIGDPGAVACGRRMASKKVEPTVEGTDRYQAVLKEFSRVYDHMLGFWQ